MTVEFNLIFIVFEDDTDLKSSFSWDLQHIAKFAQYKKLRATVISHSKKIHGDFNYYISYDDIRMEPTEPLKNSQEFMRELRDTVNKHYDPKCKNGILFSMHCYKHFLRPFSQNLCLKRWIAEMKHKGIHWEFVLFDCCYMSTLQNAMQFYGISRYLIGCQTASPYLGYNSESMACLVNRYRSNTESMLKHLVDAYIRRNNNAPHSKLLYFTDGVILNLAHLPELISSIPSVRMTRMNQARTEPDPEYPDLFDFSMLISLNPELTRLQKKAIQARIRKLVVYYKQSQLLKKKYWANRLHGVSIILKHESQKNRLVL